MGNSFAVKSVHICRDMGWVCNIKYVYLGVYTICAYIQQQCVLCCMANKNNTLHSWAAANVVDRFLLVRPFWPLAITGQASDACQSCDCAGPAGRNENKSILVVLWTPSVCMPKTQYLPQQYITFLANLPHVLRHYRTLFCKRDCNILSENSGMFVHLCMYVKNSMLNGILLERNGKNVQKISTFKNA